jgi:hypothetical protein
MKAEAETLLSEHGTVFNPPEKPAAGGVKLTGNADRVNPITLSGTDAELTSDTVFLRANEVSTVLTRILENFPQAHGGR